MQQLSPESYEWEDVSCPQCGQRINTINASIIPWIEFDFKRDPCACGYAELYKWVNPDFAGRYSRACAKADAL
jgi:hypothetical protein